MTDLRRNLGLLVNGSRRVEPNPEVAILYEDFSTGLNAKRLFDRLLSFDGPRPTYHLTMWKFNLLRVRSLREQAAQDAAAAAIVCVSGHASELPAEVTQLVGNSLSRKDTPTALVVLLEVDHEECTPENLPSVRNLQKMAEQCGAQFFLHCDAPSPRALDPLPQERAPNGRHFSVWAGNA